MSGSGKFIVVFKDSVSKADIDKYAKEVDAAGGNIAQRLDPILNGFSATIPDSFMSQLQSLQGDGVIDYIEPDSTVTTQ